MLCSGVVCQWFDQIFLNFQGLLQVNFFCKCEVINIFPLFCSNPFSVVYCFRYFYSYFSVGFFKPCFIDTCKYTVCHWVNVASLGCLPATPQLYVQLVDCNRLFLFHLAYQLPGYFIFILQNEQDQNALVFIFLSFISRARP